MSAESKGPWWRLIGALLLCIVIGMDLFVWNASKGTDVEVALQRFALGLALSFGITCLGLLLVSLGAAHRHMHWRSQILGLALFAGLGLSLAAWLAGDSVDALRSEAGMLLAGLSAMLVAGGLVFGLLLALVTGREHAPNPLLELESTGGMVPLDIED